MRARAWTVCVAAAALAALSWVSGAATITATYTYDTNLKTRVYAVPGSGPTDVAPLPTTYDGYTVKFVWTRNATYNATTNNWGGTGDTAVPHLGSTFNTFCMQLGETVGSGTFTTTTLATAPTLRGDATDKGYRALLIQALWKAHFADATTAQGISAFQIALWEIVYETSKDNTSGAWGSGRFNLNVNSGVATFNGNAAADVTDANTWLSQVRNTVYSGTSTVSDYADIWAMIGPQDQVFLTDAAATTPVPAPASVAAGMALLALNAIWYWKRRRD